LSLWFCLYGTLGSGVAAVVVCGWLSLDKGVDAGIHGPIALSPQKKAGELLSSIDLSKVNSYSLLLSINTPSSPSPLCGSQSWTVARCEIGYLILPLCNG
jgi:hypothetical protein